MSAIILDPSSTPAGLPQQPTAADLIKDTDTNSFVQDVIDVSMHTPVIVDFWAPWCGPCKTLGPMLEKLVKRAGGLIKMVKVSIDDNKNLGAQLRVQSVPTVYAFKDGRPVDVFSGALPESQIQAFLDKLIGDAKPPIEAALEQAQEALKCGDFVAAEDIYTAILAQDSTLISAFAGIIRAAAGQGDFARAREMLGRADAKTLANSLVEQALSALELAEEGVSAATTDVTALQSKVDQNPKDMDSRFTLAQALFAAGDAEAAINNLLEIVRVNRAWNDDSGRKQLIKIFDTLGPADPITVDARKRLSTVLFS